MVNAISTLSLLTSGIALQSTSIEAGMAVLKKTNDMAKLEGASLIQLLADSLPPTDERLIDVYA